jgi:hypothetical protein
LAAAPVDTKHLDKQLRAALPSARPSRGLRWARPLAALAASLLIILTAALVLMPTRTVMASAPEMAQIHRDLVSGRMPSIEVASIEEANRSIAAMTGTFPGLPAPPDAHGLACCMRSVRNKQVACVLLHHGATPVTMAVAPADQVSCAATGVVRRDGREYHLQAVDNLNMVMTRRAGRWVCLIGETSAEELIDLAASLRF